MAQFTRSLFELWYNLVNELNYVAMKFQIIIGLFGCLMHLVHQNMHCYNIWFTSFKWLRVQLHAFIEQFTIICSSNRVNMELHRERINFGNFEHCSVGFSRELHLQHFEFDESKRNRKSIVFHRKA